MWFFRGLPIRALTSPLWEAREEAKTKKPRFRKCGFFVVCPYGLLRHPCGRQGRRQKRKNHVLESVFFFGGLRIRDLTEAKTKKPRFRKCGFFVVCPYGLLRHPCGRQGRRQKRKNHVLESVVFSWFAHTGSYVTPVGGKEGGKNEKNTLCKMWLIFHGPIFRARAPKRTFKLGTSS